MTHIPELRVLPNGVLQKQRAAIAAPHRASPIDSTGVARCVKIAAVSSPG
jgi:hypothetical protein